MSRPVDSARRVVRVAQRDAPPVFVGRKVPLERAPSTLPFRVDDDDTYDAFVAERALASASLPDLATAVLSLQRAFAEHVRDGHGGKVETVIGAAVDVARLRDAALLGDGVIPVSLPPHARGKVRCWMDAGKICCSVRVKGPDGRARVVTTCSPMGDHVAEAVGYATEAGVDAIESLTYLPDLAMMIGGGKVLERLADADVAAVARTVDEVPRYGTIRPDHTIRWRP